MAEPKVGKYPAFELGQLEKIAKKKGYTQYCRDLEDKRCEADLMYRLFKRPEEVVDKLLPGFYKIVETKNSPDTQESIVFVDANKFLMLHPRADPKIKLFFVLHVIASEKEAQIVIKAGCKTEGNIWEEEWEKHLNRFFKDLMELVTEFTNAPFGETNIEERVMGFNIAAELRYISNYK